MVIMGIGRRRRNKTERKLYSIVIKETNAKIGGLFKNYLLLSFEQVLIVYKKFNMASWRMNYEFNSYYFIFPIVPFIKEIN
jgi:hypothetical protein